MLKEENLRLQRRLLRETERREQLSRQLSESESSLEMDEERQFNERARFAGSPVSYSPSPTRRFTTTPCFTIEQENIHDKFICGLCSIRKDS